MKLPTEVPNPLEFTVGRSDPAKDWFYAQTRHAKDGAKGEGKADAFEPAKWRIHFNLDRPPTGDATLTLAFTSN